MPETFPESLVLKFSSLLAAPPAKDETLHGRRAQNTAARANDANSGTAEMAGGGQITRIAQITSITRTVRADTLRACPINPRVVTRPVQPRQQQRSPQRLRIAVTDQP